MTEDRILDIGFRRQKAEGRRQTTKSVFRPLISVRCLLSSGYRRPLKQQGFSLTEVLITVLVISIGLLGLAVLQAQALKNNSQAYARTQAVLRGYDLAERIRGNPKGFQQGAYATLASEEENGNAAAAAGAFDDDEDNGQGNASGASKDCGKSSCNPAELAAYDLKKWNDLNARLLPSGIGVTCVDSTPADGKPSKPDCDGVGPTDVLAIKIWWDGNGDGKITRPASAGGFDPRKHDPMFVLSFRL